MTSTVQPGLARRDFIKAGLTAATLVGTELVRAAGENPRAIIDVNVNLSRWPLRRLPLDEVDALVSRLQGQGVQQAWAGTLDGIMHKDLPAANERLAQTCRRHGKGLLRPFGSINPALPGWEAELERCARAHRMPGIRLHPNYHGYKLEDPRFAQLLKRAADQQLVVQLALVMEDERMMHPLLRVEPVDPAPLPELIRRTPGLKLVLLNALRTVRAKALREILSAGEVCVEISMLEGVGGIGHLLEEIPLGRLLFGSHAPLFYFEAAVLKLEESPLTPKELSAIRA